MNYAEINKEVNSEFSAKYRYFLLHKWEILKAIKEKELKRKIKRNTARRFARNWIVLQAFKYHITRTWQIFNRHKDVKEILSKKMFTVLRVKIRMKLILMKRGKDLNTRMKRTIRNSLATMGGAVFRVNHRERAKGIIH